MADKEIPDLTDGGAAAAGDIAHVVRGPNSRKVTLGGAAGLSVGTTAGTVAAGDDSRFITVDYAATVGEMFAASPAKVPTSARIRDALGIVSLGNSGSGNIAFNLASGRRFSLVFTGNPTLLLPTNCAVGDEYTILGAPNNATVRTISWQSGYQGPYGVLPAFSMGTANVVTEVSCMVTAVSGSTATQVRAVLIGSEWA